MTIAPISAIGSIGATGPSAAASLDGPAASSGSGFASALGQGLDQMNQVQSTADNLAVQAATGQSIDPAALTTALTQAQLMTQLVTTVQSKAVAAFNTIMGMQA